MAEETTETGTHPAYIADGLTDDYEYWDCELPEIPRGDKIILYVLTSGIFRRNGSHALYRKYQTEAASAGDHEALILTSGARKT